MFKYEALIPARPYCLFDDLTERQKHMLQMEWNRNIRPFVTAKRRFGDQRDPEFNKMGSPERTAWFRAVQKDEWKWQIQVVNKNIGLALLVREVGQVSLNVISEGLGVERFVLLDTMSGFTEKMKRSEFELAKQSPEAFYWAHWMRRKKQWVLKNDLPFGYFFLDSCRTSRDMELIPVEQLPPLLIPYEEANIKEFVEQHMDWEEFENLKAEIHKAKEDLQFDRYPLAHISTFSPSGRAAQLPRDILFVAGQKKNKIVESWADEDTTEQFPSAPNDVEIWQRWELELKNKNWATHIAGQAQVGSICYTDDFKQKCLNIALEFMQQDPNRKLGNNGALEKQVCRTYNVPYELYASCTQLGKVWNKDALACCGGSLMEYLRLYQLDSEVLKHRVQSRQVLSFGRYQMLENRWKYQESVSTTLSFDYDLSKQLQSSPSAGDPTEKKLIEPLRFTLTCTGKVVSWHSSQLYQDTTWEQQSFSDSSRYWFQFTGLSSEHHREGKARLLTFLMEREILPWEYQRSLGSIFSEDPPFFKGGVEYDMAIPWVYCDKTRKHTLLLTREKEIAVKLLDCGVHTPFLVYTWLWHGRNVNVMKFLARENTPDDEGWAVLERIWHWVFTEGFRQLDMVLETWSPQQFNDVVFGAKYHEVKRIRQTGVGTAMATMGLLNIEKDPSDLDFLLEQSLAVPYRDLDHPYYTLWEQRVFWYLFRFVVHHAYQDVRGIRMFDISSVVDDVVDTFDDIDKDRNVILSKATLAAYSEAIRASTGKASKKEKGKGQQQDQGRQQGYSSAQTAQAVKEQSTPRSLYQGTDRSSGKMYWQVPSSSSEVDEVQLARGVPRSTDTPFSYHDPAEYDPASVEEWYQQYPQAPVLEEELAPGVGVSADLMNTEMYADVHTSYQKLYEKFGGIPREFEWANVLQPAPFFEGMTEEQVTIMHIQYGLMVDVMVKNPEFKVTGCYSREKLYSLPPSEEAGIGRNPDYIQALDYFEEIHSEVSVLRNGLLRLTRDKWEQCKSHHGGDNVMARRDFTKKLGASIPEEYNRKMRQDKISETEENFMMRHSLPLNKVKWFASKEENWALFTDREKQAYQMLYDVYSSHVDLSRAGTFEVSKEGNLLDGVHLVKHSVTLMDVRSWPWLTMGKNFSLLQQNLQYVAAQHWSTLDEHEAEVAESSKRFKNKEILNLLKKQGLYVTEVKLRQLEANVKKGFWVELTRMDGSQFVQPGFHINSAVMIHALNPDYDEEFVRQRAQKRKEREDEEYRDRKAQEGQSDMGLDEVQTQYFSQPPSEAGPPVVSQPEITTDLDPDVEEIRGYPEPEVPPEQHAYLRRHVTGVGYEHIGGAEPYFLDDEEEVLEGVRGRPRDRDSFITVGMLVASTPTKLLVRITEQRWLAYMEYLPCTIFEGITDISTERESRACRSAARMKGGNSIPSGDEKVMLFASEGVARKRFVLPGSALVPILTGKALENPYLWPSEVVGRKDKRTIREIQLDVAKEYGLDDIDASNKEIQDRITQERISRDTNNDKFDADVRKTLEVKLDGVRQLVYEYIELIFIEDSDGNLFPVNTRINHSQIDFLVEALHTKVTLLVGPGGTGKTHTCCVLAFILTSIYPEWRILFVAAQNSTCDDIITKLMRLWIRTEGRFKLPYQNVKFIRAFGRLGEAADEDTTWFPMQVGKWKKHFANRKRAFKPANGNQFIPFAFDPLKEARRQRLQAQGQGRIQGGRDLRFTDEKGPSGEVKLTDAQFQELFTVFARQKQKEIYKKFLLDPDTMYGPEDEVVAEEDEEQLASQYYSEQTRGGSRARPLNITDIRGMIVDTRKERERDEARNKQKRTIVQQFRSLDPSKKRGSYGFPRALRGMVRFGTTDTIPNDYVRAEVGLREMVQEYFNDPSSFECPSVWSRDLQTFYLNGQEAGLCKNYLEQVLQQYKIKYSDDIQAGDSECLSYLTAGQEVLQDLDQVIRKSQGAYEEHFLRLASICVGTASAAGANLHGVEFQCCIAEESSMNTDSQVLQALLRGCIILILAGDPMQLPPTVLGGCTLTQMIKAISMMVRLGMILISESSQKSYAGNPFLFPWKMLTEQYRSPADCYATSNELFYGNVVVCSAPQRPAMPWFPFPQSAYLPEADSSPATLGFLTHSYLTHQQQGQSIYNKDEAILVMKYLHYLVRSGQNPATISVICLYKEQKVLLRKWQKLQILPPELHQVKIETEPKICTVDEFQGREDEIIIICITRAGRPNSFVLDPRRMNVACTRCTRGMVVVGNMQTLQGAFPWKKLCENARSRGRVVFASNFLKTFQSDPPDSQQAQRASEMTQAGQDQEEPDVDQDLGYIADQVHRYRAERQRDLQQQDREAEYREQGGNEE